MRDTSRYYYKAFQKTRCCAICIQSFYDSIAQFKYFRHHTTFGPSHMNFLTHTLFYYSRTAGTGLPVVLNMPGREIS